MGEDTHGAGYYNPQGQGKECARSDYTGLGEQGRLERIVSKLGFEISENDVFFKQESQLLNSRLVNISGTLNGRDFRMLQRDIYGRSDLFTYISFDFLDDNFEPIPEEHEESARSRYERSGHDHYTRFKHDELFELFQALEEKAASFEETGE